MINLAKALGLTRLSFLPISITFLPCMFLKTFNKVGLSVYLVKIDPKQTYFPKISSKVTKSGTMVSNPIDKMSPEINYFNISKNTE